MPGNVTVRWYREGTLVHEVQALDSRVTVRKDNALVINPVSADDSGQYLCEVSNGIGDPQSASAYLNVECEFLVLRKDKKDRNLKIKLFSPLYLRSCQSDLHAIGAVPSVSLGRRRAVLHPGESSVAVRHLDQGQTPAGTLSNKGHCGHEQRIALVHPRQPEPSGSVHLHAVQRARHARLFRGHGGDGEETARVHDGTGANVPAKGRRDGGDEVRCAGNGGGHPEAEHQLDPQGRNVVAEEQDQTDRRQFNDRQLATVRLWLLSVCGLQ